MLHLEYENQVKNYRGTQRIFLKYLKKAEKVLTKLPKFKKKVMGTVVITMVEDLHIQALNKEYRGVNKPTDVLSFSYFGEQKFPGDDVIGEIILSVPTARRQAQDHKKSIGEELQFLFLHGLLHVFGYDHMTDSDQKVMFDLQDEIIGDDRWRGIAEAEAEGRLGIIDYKL